MLRATPIKEIYAKAEQYPKSSLKTLGDATKNISMIKGVAIHILRKLNPKSMRIPP